MYEQPSQYFNGLSEKYGVKYVLVGPWEYGKYAVDTGFFSGLEKIYEQNGVTLYRVG